MLDYTIFGESHGPAVGVLVTGRPGSFSAGPPMAPWPPPGGSRTGSAFSAAYTMDTPPGTPSA